MSKTLISWLGTSASILGAFLMAFGYAQAGYIFFSVGSISWLYIGAMTRDGALTVLNGTFFVANLIGLYRAFV